MKRTDKLATVNIKGKEYTEVHTRLQFLANNFDYEIENVVDFFPKQNMWTVACKLTLHEENGSRSYTGHAQEVIGEGYINKTSALENAETSAVGRACAMAGIGLIDAIASVDEITKAKNREQSKPAPPKKEWLNPDTRNWDRAVAYLATDGATIDAIKKKYAISKENEQKLQELTLEKIPS